MNTALVPPAKHPLLLASNGSSPAQAVLGGDSGQRCPRPLPASAEASQPGLDFLACLGL